MTIQNICIIPARAGSKGIPRKNLKLFNGKPLILNILDLAIETKAFCNIVVSSDSEEILELCATRNNVILHNRSKELSKDETPLDPVIVAASAEFMSNANICITTLQPTSPLISPKTIISALERFHKCKCDTLVSVREDSHLRWSMSSDGAAFPLYNSRQNRQYAPKEYVETGAIVICNAETIQHGSRFGSNVELFVTHHPETIDIDSPIDWELATRYSKRSKVLFNVVGGSELGFGHLYNTLALADCLPDFECIFVVPHGSSQAMEFLQSFNYRVEQVHLEELGYFCTQQGIQVLINDCLDTTKEFMLSIRESVDYVINFEDLGRGSMYADLVFNALYYDSYPLDNHLYGPEFFLLRPEFYALPANKRFCRCKGVEKVLICFGGTDPCRLSVKVLSSIYGICHQNGIHITVVLGPGTEIPDSIQERSFTGVTFLKNVSNMAALMAEADLAFSAAGRTIIELGFCGTPSIVLAQNARELLHTCVLPTNGVINLGLGSEVDNDQISDIFSSLIASSERIQAMIDHLKASFQHIAQSTVSDRIRGLVLLP